MPEVSLHPSLPLDALYGARLAGAFAAILAEHKKIEPKSDKCAVEAVVGTTAGERGEYARLVAQGLKEQQHRGLDGSGIAALSGNGDQGFPSLAVHKGAGKVAEVFPKSFDFTTLPGQIAIGHDRYGTQGGQCNENLQPIVLESTRFGWIAVAHNGNLINTAALTQELRKSGATFSSTSDSELFVQLVEHAPKDLDVTGAVTYALSRIRGAYSIVLVAGGRLFAARDPFGVRPLVLAHFDDGSVGIASETKAFANWLNPRYRQVLPGELIEVSRDRVVHSHFPHAPSRSAFCVFELIYVSYPTSFWNGRSIKQIREGLGEALARSAPPGQDLKNAIIVPVLNSGLYAAQGYSRATGIALDLALTRNFDDRTFIQADQASRDQMTVLKHTLDMASVVGKEVYIVDDSIVRGTTMRKLVNLFREAGATTVHVRSACPPIRHPCFYGIDTEDPAQLLANQHPSFEEMTRYIGADSLGFLSLDDMYRSLAHMLGMHRNQFCDACFTGDYPLGTPADHAVQNAGRIPLPVRGD